jgi:hypothetical protein
VCWDHLVQHRLHLTRIGSVHPKVRKQHDHVKKPSDCRLRHTVKEVQPVGRSKLARTGTKARTVSLYRATFRTVQGIPVVAPFCSAGAVCAGSAAGASSGC